MDFLQKFWKAILLILAISLLIVLISFLAYLMQWSVMKVVAIILLVMAGVFGVWGALRVWKWYRQYRSERDALEKASPSVKQKLVKLDALFKSATRRIKKSRLRARGNPLYVLPWFVLVGTQGSGKTYALKNSRVSIPLLEGKSAPDPADDLCQWWLMEESIAIELPHRYLFDESQDNQAEWKHFLKRLKSTRPSQPINGMIIALPADELIKANVQQLRARAELYRSKLAEMIADTGVHIPVYLLVTKLDKLAGALSFFERFPDSALNQAMGVLLEENIHGPQFNQKLADRMSQFKSRLDKMRYSVLLGSSPSDIRANELSFVEDLAACSNSITLFSKALFDLEYYREAPLLRGIYFCSAHQSGSSVSLFDKELSRGSMDGPATPQDKSYFLRGFLGTVLKQEKEIVSQTESAVWRLTLRHNLGLVAWICGCVAVGILFTHAFYQNLRIINDATKNLQSNAGLKGTFASDLNSLTAIQDAIVSIEKSTQNSFVARNILGVSGDLSQKLANLHNSRFQRVVLNKFNTEYESKLSHLMDDPEPARLANYVDFMTKKIKIAQMALEEKAPLAELLADYQANAQIFEEILNLSDSDKAAQVSSAFTAYIHWSKENQNEQLIKTERSKLEALLKNPDIGLNWLIPWANMQPTLEDVTTRRYWDVEPTGTVYAKVSRAFTPEGWSAIGQLLAEIERVVLDREVMVHNRSQFLEEYRSLYFLAWRAYMEKFDSAVTAFQGADKRQKMAILVSGKDTPFLKFLNDLPNVLSPVMPQAEKGDENKEQEPEPSWVTLSMQLAKLSSQEYQDQVKNGNKLVSKIVKKGANLLGKAGKLALKATKSKKKKKEATEDQIVAVVARYQENIVKLGQQVKSPVAAFELTKAAFTEAGTVVGEPQAVANKLDWDLQQMEEMLGEGDADEDIVWKFMRRQFELTWSAVVERTAQHLQQVWQDEVLTAGDNLSGWAKIDALQGEKGKIWEFQNTHLSAYVKKARGGYDIKKLYGSTMAFTPQMMHLLNNGKVGGATGGGTATIAVSALPTGVNNDADVKPHLTKLTLQCGSGNIELDNYNYPIQKKFTWNPAECADVILQIYVGDVVCERKYSGFNAFNEFVKDFKGGPKTYAKELFPAQAGRLAGYRVKNITVGFQFSGQSITGGGSSKSPAEVPERMLVFSD